MTTNASPLPRDGTAQPVREWIPQVAQEIAEAVHPRRIILFGSVARGDDGPGSDLDLMVVFDHLDKARRRELQAKIMAAVTAPVPFRRQRPARETWTRFSAPTG